MIRAGERDKSFVYFIRPVGAEGPVKIGCSIYPVRRLDTLMAWAPTPLEVVATIPGNHRLERNIQECFCDQRSHSEWFHASPRLTALIEALRGGAAIEDVLDLQDKRGRMRSCEHVTESFKKRMSYVHRVNWANRKLRTETHYYITPDDIYDILARWGGYWNRAKQEPSKKELARLDEFLAEPAKHSSRRLIHALPKKRAA